MGANNSTRRVSFESDENENITIVKGIRLSEKVIDRMREPSGPPQPPTRTPPASPPVVDPLPALVPISSPPDPVTSLPPSSLPERVRLPEQVTTTAPPPPPPPVILPPPPPVATSESVGAASAPAVDESELRRKISEELQKGLEEERRKAKEELNQWLEKEKSQAHVEAQAEAQAQVKDEVSRILALEKEQSIQKAILREKISAEDERLQAQIYARQLEERDKELRKQDAFYREQVAKLKERSGQFYKVTNENYHKAADEVNAKFKRYEISPVCTDLQGQILKCYRENAGKTLLCSNIASLYMQCVNSAKQEKLRTGG
ncbi:coiled-coil-helix-coiled-coil-helix domain containing 3a isoform X6 [Puntigrus tetrazona]|uniref:coiled-coil-helix-coiled-coil-helix domain containing 3a isoform X6 n=1 Tax=Puntigrus tetrazona TaxID=1606681 RepID=UPI001C8A84BD|nr:coiled-coil-helix-coiled-coil-helix domain containing 3a isoform X6 [Puntigrus tetrazona]